MRGMLSGLLAECIPLMWKSLWRGSGRRGGDREDQHAARGARRAAHLLPVRSRAAGGAHRSAHRRGLAAPGRAGAAAARGRQAGFPAAVRAAQPAARRDGHVGVRPAGVALLDALPARRADLPDHRHAFRNLAAGPSASAECIRRASRRAFRVCGMPSRPAECIPPVIEEPSGFLPRPRRCVPRAGSFPRRTGRDHQNADRSHSASLPPG